MTGMVFNIMRYALHDGPGIRTTVFLKGCPLRCKWCHNPEALAREAEVFYWPDRCLRCWDCLAACPQGAIASGGGQVVTDRTLCARCGACLEVCHADAREIVGHAMSIADVVQEIEKDQAFFDESGGGVTFSGGEPLLQADFLLALLRECKRGRIHTTVDTTGFAAPATLRGVAELTDLFLYDLKAFDDGRHRDLTGVSNETILSNLWSLSAEGHALIIRMPVIPGLNDDAENVQRTGAFVAALPQRHDVHLLPYHPTALEKYKRLGLGCPLPATAAASTEEVSRVADRLRQFGLTVAIGG